MPTALSSDLFVIGEGVALVAVESSSRMAVPVMGRWAQSLLAVAKGIAHP